MITNSIAARALIVGAPVAFVLGAFLLSENFADRVLGVMGELLEWSPERREDEQLRWQDETTNVFGVNAEGVPELTP